MTAKTHMISPETMAQPPDMSVHLRRLSENEVLANHPILRPDNDMLYNGAFDYVFRHLDEPLDTEDMIRELRERRGLQITPTDTNIARMDALMRTWGKEMIGHLAEENITGKLVKGRDGLVFASNPHDVKIHRLAEGMMSRSTAQQGRSAAEIRDAIWNEPTVEPVHEGLIPESELTPVQRKILGYMSRISVKAAASYPSENELSEKIAGGTKSYTPEAVHLIFNGLIKERFLFKYRKDGKDYVTTNANVAFSENMKRRPHKSRNEAAPKPAFDTMKAKDLVVALLASDEGKYTPKKLWSLLQNSTSDAEGPTIEQEAEVKEMARMLARNDVITAGNFKPQEGGVSRSSKREGFRIGLKPEQRERLGQMSPDELGAYLTRLLA